MLVHTRAARPAGFIEPCLPSRAQRPPSGPGWVHEIKQLRVSNRTPAPSRRTIMRKPSCARDLRRCERDLNPRLGREDAPVCSSM